MKNRKIIYLICILALSIFVSSACGALGASDSKKDKPDVNDSNKLEDNKKSDDSDKKADDDKQAEGEKKPDNSSDKEGKKSNVNSPRLNFNDNETENLKKAIKQYSVTLIEDDNQEHNDVDLDKVEAIAIYEDDSSYGWICKYDDNKIGVAQVPHETIYENGEEYHPVQIVKIWGEKHIYEGGSSGIKDNDPKLFKAASKEIAKTFHFDDGLQIKFLFD